MSRNGSGTYSLPAGNPVVTGTTISSTWANNTLSDIATALTQSIASDGQTTPTANLPMGTFKHTGVAVGASLTDYARYDQLQNSAPQWLTGVAGTDTITASAPVTPAAYAAGQTFKFVSAGANTGAVTLNISSLGAKSVTKTGTTALVANDIPSGAVVLVVYDGTQFQLVNVAKANELPSQTGNAGKVLSTNGSAASWAYTDNSIQDFRLTLTSGTPVTTSDVTAATTIYCTPYKGNRIALYDGSAQWNIRVSAEFSLALGTLTSGTCYDVFCYDNAGTPTLEFLAWTNATTRATALAYQDGILVKSGATTRRYLGTFYTTSTTTTEDSVSKRALYNYYNRSKRQLIRVESTASWNYTTATYRQANNAAANQIAALQGVAEDAVKIDVGITTSNSTGSVAAKVGVGIDSTTVDSSQRQWGGATANIAPTNCTYEGVPSAGFHNYAWLEYSTAAGTTTWYGTTYGFGGMVGEVYC